MTMTTYVPPAKEQNKEAVKAHKLLHLLWSKAVGTEDYNKEEWMSLQRFIEEYANMKNGEDQRP